MPPRIRSILFCARNRERRAEVAEFLFAVERLLVAAERRNVPAPDIGELAGISPVLRDASWRRIDSQAQTRAEARWNCWMVRSRRV